MLALVVVNVNVGVLVGVGPVGPPVMTTVGPCVTTVNDRDAIAVFPAASATWTANVWGPSVNPVTVVGDAHVA